MFSTIYRISRFGLMVLAVSLATSFATFGCNGDGKSTTEDNPFFEDYSDPGKADTGWITASNAPEVEVVLEGEMEVPGRWQFLQGPTDQSQFALTYLRKHYKVYIESQFVVPDHRRQVEWWVDGQWVPANQVDSHIDVTTLSRFRILGVNAIVYKPEDADALVGKTYDAVVPRYPYFIMTNHGGTCATNTSHALWDDDYWYFWDPDRSECQLEKATMTATIVKKVDHTARVYPEYDKLLEDGKITVVAFFGAYDSSTDPMENDPGYRGMITFTHKLEQAGFEKGESPDGLWRYTKTSNGIEFVVDVSTPKDFYGLDDYEHASVFQKGVKSHEVVIYNGHSILGTSTMWKQDIYTDSYQLFYFNGCLGYEYYVGAILEGKGSWDKTDVISNVKETPSAPQPVVLAAFLSALFQGAENGGTVDFATLLAAINSHTYNSIYGVSGARTNCFSPDGESLCDQTKTYENNESMAIPDGDANGLQSTIEVSDSATVGVLSCSVDITHPWVGDLVVRLEHDGVEAILWQSSGNSGTDLHETFTLDAFAGMEASGVWTLTVIDSLKPDSGTLNGWSLTITKADE